MFAALMLFGMSPLLRAQESPRVVEDLDYGWKFHLGEAEGAEASGYDDTGWRTVDVPHDFQIEQDWVEPAPDERPDESNAAANIRSRLSSRGFKEMGVGWYRRSVTPSESLKGKRVLLDFEGIMYVADVYLNGVRIGGTDYGYVGFEIDVTKLLKYGEKNVIAVKANTQEPNNSRWYTGGGLFRDVKLVSTDAKTFFARHPLYITTRDNKEVDIQAEFGYYDGNPAQVTMGVVIKDPDGKVVVDEKQEVKRLKNLRVQECKLSPIKLSDAKLWDCEHPNLYTATLTLYKADGTVGDVASQTFGVREIEFSPKFGMKLNGKKVLLKGIANHHTLGALGAAAYPRAIEKRIQMLKDYGFNHIRSSHNPYSESMLDLCDRYGILVVDELYDKWTKQHTGGRVPWEYHWQYDVPEWVKRDRNHPSVVFWSLGNELQQDPNQAFNDWGVTAYRLQKTLLDRYDTTRLVTVAMHPRYRNWETDSLPCALAMITDIQAYNYRYMYFPGDGRRFPRMMFYQSEASIAAMGQNYFEMDLDKVIGLAYWGAIDYLGESQGWPAKGWEQGVFDMSLNPKPKAAYVRSFFKPEEPIVKIAVVDKKGDQMWNGVQTGNDGMSDHWNRVEGKKLNIITYTNAEEVELIVNGKSQGVKKNDVKNAKMRNQIRWNDIEYHAGYAEAIARTKGKVVARHRIETTGKAVKLIAETDNSAWKADGLDLQHVRIRAVDSKGRTVPMANDMVTVSVLGDARLVVMDNGDINSPEKHTDGKRSLYMGRALAIVRAGKTAGNVTLKVTAPGFKAVTLSLKTVE